MTKEFSPEQCLETSDAVLRGATVVASNLAFEAAGLEAAGLEADEHRRRMLKSALYLESLLGAFMRFYADGDEIEAARISLMEDMFEEGFAAPNGKEGIDAEKK